MEIIIREDRELVCTLKNQRNTHKIIDWMEEYIKSSEELGKLTIDVTCDCGDVIVTEDANINEMVRDVHRWHGHYCEGL